jgi:twinkle protein
MVNMSKNLSWKWAIASFENPPAHHIPKLMEKFTEKPFYKGQSQRISPSEMAASKEFLDDHFVFLEQKDGSMSTIQDIIARIKLAITRCGVRGAVIDPYNYIDMSAYEAEHLGISVMLSELSAFARANGVAIFFVAHPQKLFTRDDGTLPVPKGNHISGSAAWWAKADIGLTVHRAEFNVEIHCWKARFKWLGSVGMRSLDYNIVNGKYSDSSRTNKKQWSEMSNVLDKSADIESKINKGWDDIDF